LDVFDTKTFNGAKKISFARKYEENIDFLVDLITLDFVSRLFFEKRVSHFD
jgi:hypothetical protein